MQAVGAWSAEGLGLVSTAAVTPSGETALTPITTHNDVLLVYFIQTLEEKLVTLRKIVIVATYLSSHSSLTEVSTFSSTK